MAVIKHGSGATSAFKTVKVSGQSDVVADDGSDDLTLAAGSNVTLTTNASTDTVTIAAAGGAALAGIDDQSSSLDDCITILDAEVVINEDGDDQDFRVEGDTNTHLLFADAGTEKVGVRTSAPIKPLHVTDSALVKGGGNFVLTGTIDPAASATVTGVGTAFLTEVSPGDDIVVSGETRTVKAIASNTSLTLYEAFTNGSNDTSPECTPAAFSVQRSDGTPAITVNGNRGVVLDVTGDTPFIQIRNTAETEAGISISDDAAPIAQFAKLLVDSGSAESGLTAGFSIMTAGGTLTGAVNATASTAVVGVGTAFTTELKVGDRLILRENNTSDGDSETRAITAITDNTNLTVSPAFSDLGNDTTPAYEARAMQIQSNGDIGMGVKPSTAGEKLVLNGAMALKVQASAPSATADYTKIYSLAGGDVVDIQQATAKAWASWNGTGTVALHDSYNVSSLADNGVGAYTISFANNMANTNYSFSGCTDAIGTGGTVTLYANDQRAVGSIKVATFDDNTQEDNDVVTLQIFGD